MHPTQITDWKQQLRARGAAVSSGVQSLTGTPDPKTLHAKIGQLTLENNFLAGARIKAGLLSAEQ